MKGQHLIKGSGLNVIGDQCFINLRISLYSIETLTVVIELGKEFDLNELKKVLADAPGLFLQDDPANAVYPMAITAKGKNETFVGRIRRDESIDNGVNLWVVADNIRKGAATNAVQIAQKLIEMWESGVITR